LTIKIFCGFWGGVSCVCIFWCGLSSGFFSRMTDHSLRNTEKQQYRVQNREKQKHS